MVEIDLQNAETGMVLRNFGRSSLWIVLERKGPNIVFFCFDGTLLESTVGHFEMLRAG